MFERFTDRARRVVVLAQEEARMLNHNYIGTEHILLGLVHEGDGVAARVLSSMDISLEAVRMRVEEIIGQGQAAPAGHIPFTPRAKKVLELSLREALQLGDDYIGTEHILLGLVREGEGVAFQVLTAMGADAERLRESVIEMVQGHPEMPAAEGTYADVGNAAVEESAAAEWAAAQEPPNCPRCRAPLAETLAIKALDVSVDDQPGRVKVAYCTRCGTALGTVP